MPKSKPSRRVDLSLDADLMERLVRYARQRNTSPEDVLVQSVQWFLDQHPTSEPAPGKEE